MFPDETDPPNPPRPPPCPPFSIPLEEPPPSDDSPAPPLCSARLLPLPDPAARAAGADDASDEPDALRSTLDSSAGAADPGPAAPPPPEIGPIATTHAPAPAPPAPPAPLAALGVAATRLGGIGLHSTSQQLPAQVNTVAWRPRANCCRQWRALEPAPGCRCATTVSCGRAARAPAHPGAGSCP